MIKTLTFILLAIGIPIICTPNDPSPPVLPNSYSQQMLAQFKEYNTTGKIWYDWHNQMKRQDWGNGLSTQACGQILKEQTPCRRICKNNRLYNVFPDKNLCCYSQFCTLYFPDWVQRDGWQFKGQKPIGNQSFYEWEDPNVTTDRYYVDKSSQRIPRRHQLGSYFTIDYLTNTFVDGPIDKSVFDVPVNCPYCYAQDFMKLHNLKPLQRSDHFENLRK